MNRWVLSYSCVHGRAWQSLSMGAGVQGSQCPSQVTLQFPRGLLGCGVYLFGKVSISFQF